MLNPFEQLKIVSTSPHHDFEEAAWLIVKSTEPHVRKVALSQGDGGVDAAQGTWGQSGEMQVFQFKYFTEKIGPSQRKQIDDSFKTAKSNSLINLKKWTLVLPARLRKECLHWFEEWKKAQGDAVDIALWDGDDLVQRLEDSRCVKARRFLKSRGISGVGEELPLIIPFAQTFRSTQRGSGIGYVVKLALENKSETTVTNVRLVVQHTETGCVAGGHDENWWEQEQEAFMSYNPRKLNGDRDIHPNAPIPVLQILLRSGDSFEVTIMLSISATDLPMQWWQIVISEDCLKNGTVVRGTEIDFEDVSDLQTALKQPRIFSRAKPVSDLAIELLQHIKAHPEDSTRGLTVIRRENPGDPTLTAFIPSSKPAGSTLAAPKEDLPPAIIELQQLGWLGNPTMTKAVIIYRYQPEN